MGVLGDIARTAVVAGTWTAVSNRVSRRQAGRWAAEDQSNPRQQQAYMPPPPGRYQRPMFQQRSQQQPPAHQQPSAADQVAPQAPDPMTTRLAQLQQLGALKAQGILTDEEFQRQKRLVLSGSRTNGGGQAR